MKTIFGGLFEFQSNQELEEFMDNIDNHTSIKIIELALLYCQKNGLFDFQESTILFKSLNKLKKSE